MQHPATYRDETRVEAAQAALSSAYRSDNRGLDTRIWQCARSLDGADVRNDHLWDVIRRLSVLVAELEDECGVLS